MERRTLQVPQPDRTMLRLCSAVQLGPLAIHVNGPSDSARRREARPHPLSMYRGTRFGTSRVLSVPSRHWQGGNKADWRLGKACVLAQAGWAGEKVARPPRHPYFLMDGEATDSWRLSWPGLWSS
jgi:hypothetical protein